MYKRYVKIHSFFISQIYLKRLQMLFLMKYLPTSNTNTGITENKKKIIF